MSIKLNCIIVDDEPLARRGIEHLVAEFPFLQIVASCANPLQVMSVLEEQPVELLFLDVQMPKMTGFEFLRSYKKRLPLTIITTAYQQYALDGYELDVIDYLIKPVSLERFAKAVNKAREFYLLSQGGAAKPRANDDHCFIKCDKRYEKIRFDEILFIQAAQNYIIIQTKTKRLISYLTFRGVEEYLPRSQFLKVQKSYLVSRSRIEQVDGTEVVVGSFSIPISRQHREEVIAAILGNKLLKR